MGKELSSRERYLLAFRHEEGDRVPIDLHCGESFRLPGVPQHPRPEDRIRGIRGMGGDPIVDIWLPAETPDADVTARKGTCGKDERGYPLRFAEWETPAGTLREVVRETEDWRDLVAHQHLEHRTLGDGCRAEGDYDVYLFDDWNCSRFVEAPVKTIRDVEALRHILRVPTGEALTKWREDAKEAKRIARENDLLLRARRTFGAEAGLWFMKTEDYLCATISDTELVEAMVDVVTGWQIARAELALEIGVDVLMHRGWYETPDYFGGERYLKFCKPLIEKLARMCHEAGVQLSYQRTQGNSKQIEVTRTLPIDHLWGPQPGSGQEDMALLKREIGDRITLWGGVETTYTVNEGMPAEIDAAVKKAMETCAPGGGYVVMPIEDVYGATPAENIRAAVEAAKKYGKY
ncbi:MAG: uroporphyrinogen decarboxylase family protein [Planctomycetota bacterium]